MEVILRILFLSLSNTDVKFAELKKPTWKIYNAAEVLSIPNQIELIDKREFAKVALDENSETSIMYILAL